jgi:beta-aspartyl-peptidase (threonine type)
MESVIIVHSGAGYFPDEKNPGKYAITKKAVIEGYKVLMETGNPVDAVERAVRVMEDNPACNAGK